MNMDPHIVNTDTSGAFIDFRAYWGGDERREVCLAVLRPHGQGRHEARQSYGLELPSLEVICPRWRRQLGIQLAVPTLPKAKAKGKCQIRMVGGVVRQR
jgi:hypothetical protein